MYPVILFVFNKPELTLSTLRALENNTGSSETDVFIFADGPKTGAENIPLNQNVSKVREIIRQKYNFKSLTISEAHINQGLAKSVINGVSKVLESYEAAIIVEDDVLTSRYFISFMNAQLNNYKNHDRVFSIGSWNYFSQDRISNFFLRVTDSIAWGVYKRSWQLFETDSLKLINRIEQSNKIKAFNVDNSYDYFAMLKMQSENKVDSWAIRWYATCFLYNGLTLYPSKSLSKHIGFGDNATHCSSPEDVYRQYFEVENNLPSDDIIRIQESPSALKSFKYFYHSEKPPIRKILFKKFKSFFR
jgi:hypothetical protein